MAISTIDMLLVVTLVICVYTDIRWRRIPNKVLLVTLILGWALMGWEMGTFGLAKGLLGLITGFLLLLIPHLAGGMGAGDVKLMAIIGALKGPEFVLNTFIGTGICGGILAIAVLLWQHRLGETVSSLFRGFVLWLKSGLNLSGLLLWSKTWSQREHAYTLPYAVAIAVGTLASWAVTEMHLLP